MRILAKFVLGILLLLLIAVVAGWFARIPLTEYFARQYLNKQGFNTVGFEIEALGPRGAIVRDISVSNGGQSSLLMDVLDVRYDWRTLFDQRRVNSVTIGPGRMEMSVKSDGTILLPIPKGVSATGKPAAQSSSFRLDTLPLDEVVIAPIDLTVATPEGRASFTIEGTYDVDKTGQFTFQGSADHAGICSLILENFSADGRIDLQSNGSILLESNTGGDVITPSGRADGVMARIEGQGTSWIDLVEGRETSPQGEMRVVLSSATVTKPELAVIERSGEEPETSVSSISSVWDAIQVFSVSGALVVLADDDGVTLRATDAPILQVMSDQGDRFVLSGVEENVIASLGPEGDLKFAATSRLDSSIISVSTKVDGVRSRNGRLNFSGDIQLPQQEFIPTGAEGHIKIKPIQSIFTGIFENGKFALQGTLDGVVTSLDIPPLSAQNLNISQIYNATYTHNNRQLTVQATAGGCLQANTAILTIPSEGVSGMARALRMCPTQQPLLTIDFAEQGSARFGLSLLADRVDYKQASITYEGQPPNILLEGEYDGAQQSVDLTGLLQGGNAILNNAFRLTQASGAFSARADVKNPQIPHLVADAQLNRIRIDQYQKPAMIAPLIGQGNLQYQNGSATFQSTVSTLEGKYLGQGQGQHRLETGLGTFEFITDGMTFIPDGLQPDEVILSTTGIIGNATGVVSGRAQFDWGPGTEPMRSNAMVTTKNLSFIGPGTAITRTDGINTTLRLTELFPVTSDGSQQLTIDLVDMNALKLENGSIEFAFPGDETLAIIQAAFPWFGGTIGVENTSASMTGDEIRTDLLARNVDFGQLLEFLDIDGLSGEGVVEGTLPLVILNGRTSIVNGVFRATQPGSISLDNTVAEQIRRSNEQTAIAFDILRDLRFDTLEATVNGDLDGTLRVGLVFEGINAITIQDQRVPSPVIYRISIEAPMTSLLSQRMRWQNLNITPN